MMNCICDTFPLLKHCGTNGDYHLAVENSSGDGNFLKAQICHFKCRHNGSILTALLPLKPSHQFQCHSRRNTNFQRAVVSGKTLQLNYPEFP